MADLETKYRYFCQMFLNTAIRQSLESVLLLSPVPATQARFENAFEDARAIQGSEQPVSLPKIYALVFETSPKDLNMAP
jgi:hypothetical protein